METHLSSPYQSSAHVPMWTGPWISQKCAIRLLPEISKSYEENHLVVTVLCIYRKQSVQWCYYVDFFPPNLSNWYNFYKIQDFLVSRPNQQMCEEAAESTFI